MSYVTVKVEIDHGRIVPIEPEKLPEKADGLLTILLPQADSPGNAQPVRQRVELPLIQGAGKHIINPSPAELDASAWSD